MRYIRWLVVFIFPLLLCQCADDGEEGSIPPVYVQYHIWFKTGSCIPGDTSPFQWYHWRWTDNEDPCRTVQGIPWVRDISSPGYPLIGPYDSGDENVMRWHIWLAKAAGIDGFFVSCYSWHDNTALSDTLEKMLRIAHEENFKLGLEVWHPKPDEVNIWKNEVIRLIDVLSEESPHGGAFLRISDRPDCWFSFGDRWMRTEELLEFLDRRSVTWLIMPRGSTSELINWNRQLKNSKIQQPVYYNLPTSTGWSFNTDFSETLTKILLFHVGNRFMSIDDQLIPIAHGYPGFDEQHIANLEPDRPYRYGLRGQGQVLRNLLAASATSNAKMILLESFNDWTEYTMLEPGINIVRPQGGSRKAEAVFSEDPYKYLKIIAEFKNKEWVTPQLPPCTSVDPLVVQQGVSCN